MTEPHPEIAPYKYHVAGPAIGLRTILLFLLGGLGFAIALNIITVGQGFLIFIIGAVLGYIRDAVSPESGLTINNDEINLYSGKWRAKHIWSEIDHIKYIKWAGTAGFEIHLKKGKHLSIPRKCYGEAAALADYLDHAGIAVEKSAYNEEEQSA